MQTQVLGCHSQKPATKSASCPLVQTPVLRPLFGIQDLRNDDRVGFMSGLKGVTELKRSVDRAEFDFAFGLFPVSMEQFFKFSDEGLMMPPKTTWFEPKLLNGLVIYDIYDGENRNS
jgi:uncharacterized protein (DUF1015 family)